MKRRTQGKNAQGWLGRMARQGALYALGSAVVKLGGLLLLPIYLDPDFLSQADYGRLGLIETLAHLLAAFAGLGLISGLLRYASEEVSDDERGSLGFTALVATVGAAALAAGAVWAASAPLAALFLDDAGRAGIIALAGAYAALKAIGAVPLMLIRVRERAGLYILAVMLELVILVGGAWYFLVEQRLGLEGALFAFVLAAGATTALLCVLALARLPWRFEPRLARRLLTFGLPLTFGSLATILLNTGDRFLLEALAGAEVLGLYVLAAKFGSLVYMLFVQSFNMSFAVLGLKATGEASGDGSRLHIRTFRHFVTVAGWGVLGVAVLALDATALLSPDASYQQAEPLILPVALGYLLYGVYFIGVNLLYSAERTRSVALNVLVAAVLNAVLNVVLIPVLGGMGAALATLVSYAFLAAVTAWQARRYMQVGFPWWALATVLLVVGGLWALAQPSHDWPTLWRLGYRVGLVALYPVLALVAGIYTRDELRQSWRALRRFLGWEHAETP